jgi:hypothetical protein
MVWTMHPRSKDEDEQYHGNPDYDDEPDQMMQLGPVDTDPVGKAAHFRLPGKQAFILNG